MDGSVLSYTFFFIALHFRTICDHNQFIDNVHGFSKRIEYIHFNLYNFWNCFCIAFSIRSWIGRCALYLGHYACIKIYRNKCMLEVSLKCVKHSLGTDFIRALLNLIDSRLRLADSFFVTGPTWHRFSNCYWVKKYGGNCILCTVQAHACALRDFKGI